MIGSTVGGYRIDSLRGDGGVGRKVTRFDEQYVLRFAAGPTGRRSP